LGGIEAPPEHKRNSIILALKGQVYPYSFTMIGQLLFSPKIIYFNIDYKFFS
jgi:hypothetical protein